MAVNSDDDSKIVDENRESLAVYQNENLRKVSKKVSKLVKSEHKSEQE